MCGKGESREKNVKVGKSERGKSNSRKKRKCQSDQAGTRSVMTFR